MRILPRSRKTGFALPIALLAIILLLLMGSSLLELGLKTRIFVIRNTSDISARCAADAGLTQALSEMNNKLKVKPWNGTGIPQAIDEILPNSNATYSFYITGDIINGYSVTSIGICGQNQQTVSCDLELQGPFEAAIFVKENIELKNSARVDWYNNGPDDSKMQVATNSTLPGTVILKNSSYINGDVLIGRDGNPDSVIKNFGATITGQIYAMTQIISVPPVIVPDFLACLPDGGTLKNNITISNSAKYESIDLKNNKTITIDGNVSLYIVGDVTLNNSAQIVIENDSSLILYLGGELEAKNSSIFNNETQNPKDFQIYALDSCQSMVLKNNSDFYGTIYAPNTEVTLNNSTDIYGAIVARSFIQKNSGDFNYDASLRDIDSDDEMVNFEITNWSEH